MDGLKEIRSCRKVGKEASEIRVGDVVIEDVVTRQMEVGCIIKTVGRY